MVVPEDIRQVTTTTRNKYKFDMVSGALVDLYQETRTAPTTITLGGYAIRRKGVGKGSSPPTASSSTGHFGGRDDKGAGNGNAVHATEAIANETSEIPAVAEADLEQGEVDEDSVDQERAMTRVIWLEDTAQALSVAARKLKGVQGLQRSDRGGRRKGDSKGSQRSTGDRNKLYVHGLRAARPLESGSGMPRRGRARSRTTSGAARASTALCPRVAFTSSPLPLRQLWQSLPENTSTKARRPTPPTATSPPTSF